MYGFRLAPKSIHVITLTLLELGVFLLLYRFCILFGLWGRHFDFMGLAVKAGMGDG